MKKFDLKATAGGSSCGNRRMPLYHFIAEVWSRRAAWFLGFAVALGWFLAAGYFSYRLNDGMTKSGDFVRNPILTEYGRVKWWLASAYCMQERRVFLGVCGEDGAVYPLEEAAMADDSGHAILANIAAVVLPHRVNRFSLAKINIGINAVGILCLSGILMLVGMPWMSTVFLIIGAFYGLPGPVPGADAQASFIGELCLSQCPVVWLASQKFPMQLNWKNVGGLMWGLCCLYGSYLLRQPLGMVGVVSSIGVISARMVFSTRENRKKNFKQCFVISFLVLLVGVGAAPLLLLRDRIWNLSHSKQVLLHGFSHTLYLGLGTGPNPWNIDYNNDAVGQEAALRIDPNARYGTPLYFKTIRKLYLNIVIKNPFAVLKIYLAKVKTILSLPLCFLRINIFFFPPLALLWGAFYQRLVGRPSLVVNASMAMAFSLILFSLQGVLAKPDAAFLYPAKPIVVLVVINIVFLNVAQILRSRIRPNLSCPPRAGNG